MDNALRRTTDHRAARRHERHRAGDRAPAGVAVDRARWCSPAATPATAAPSPSARAALACRRSRRVPFDAADFAAHDGVRATTSSSAYGDLDVVIVAFGVLGEQSEFDDDPAARGGGGARSTTPARVASSLAVAAPVPPPRSRSAGRAVQRRRRAGAQGELRLRLVEGRPRRLRPGPRRLARRQRRVGARRATRVRQHQDDDRTEGGAAVDHAPTRSPTPRSTALRRGSRTVWVPGSLRFVFMRLPPPPGRRLAPHEGLTPVSGSGRRRGGRRSRRP